MASLQAETTEKRRCSVAVIWIDWYPYHVARFRGLLSAFPAGEVAGIEMVGSVGVHAGLKFRESLPEELQVRTLAPNGSWQTTSKLSLSVGLWRHLNELSPEAVLVPGYYTLPGITAALWARAHGRQSVLMTESTYDDHERNPWREGVKRAIIRLLFDWAVSGGKAHVAYLNRLGFPSERIVGKYDVVDNTFFSQEPFATSLEIPEALKTSGYFLYVGRLAAEKNVSTLLRAWQQYREQGGHWPLVLVGDGPQREDLEEIARAGSFSGDVHFVGLKTSHALPAYYASAGAFVLPSIREPWGLVVNEAMASGLPLIISNRCGCVPDLLEEEGNGFLFDPDDVSLLTALLSRMSRMPEQDRRRMGDSSKLRIAQFTPEGFGQSVAQIVQPSSNRVASRTSYEVQND